MQYEIEATETFIKWQGKLKDRQAARAIAGRLILLLNGGDKSSQQRDIRRARQILKELED